MLLPLCQSKALEKMSVHVLRADSYFITAVIKMLAH